MEASLAARSPVTLPGYHAGQLPAHAGHRLPPEVLTPEEARALLRVPSPRAPTGIRNRALLAVLYRGGLSISEALALERRDLHAAACTLTAWHGKGNRHRTIGMDPAAFALVARWLDEWRRVGPHRPTVVFCTLERRPLPPSHGSPLPPRPAR